MINIERAFVYIDLKAVEHNFRAIKSLLAPDVKVLCVVKADAYGHGSVEIARRLEALGANYLGVATTNEGMKLRSKGIKLPILIMSGILMKDEIKYVYENMLTPVVHDINTLKELKEESLHHAEALKVHIKIDTGMGRLGFSTEELPALINEIKDPYNLRIEGLMSHFASSERRDEYGFRQISILNNALQSFRQNNISPEIVHMSNSGAVAKYPEACFNMIRAGIALYGSYPSKELSDILHLKPVMKFTSRVALIKEFPPGFSLSYGRTFTTVKRTRVAYIPVGYADGYPRSLSNRGSVIINNQRCSIVGRVCMDWMLADITDKGSIDVGEEVILLGSANDDAITADEIAELTDTIPYEILCNVSKRVPRFYV